MSKDAYVGVAGKARRVTDIYVGVGGVARKVRGAFVGDEEGKARLFHGYSFVPGVITPDNMTGNDEPAPYRARMQNENPADGKNFYAHWAFYDSLSVYCKAGAFYTIGSDILPTPWWIDIDLGEARYANQIRLRLGYAPTSSMYGFPKDFKVLGSNDGELFNEFYTSDNWDVLGNIVAYPDPLGSLWGKYRTLDNPNFYRYYRLHVTRFNKAPTEISFRLVLGQMELSAALSPENT